MPVKVAYEIGHNATPRDSITPEGYTHDWTLYIRGCNSSDISIYIDKIVFHLHESFARPKRGEQLLLLMTSNISQILNELLFTVFKEPPYVLKESGCGSFDALIEIYFKHSGNPKKVTYTYDLCLDATATIAKVETKTQLFKNPSPTFTMKLINGGGRAISQPDHHIGHIPNRKQKQISNKENISNSNVNKKGSSSEAATTTNVSQLPTSSVSQLATSSVSQLATSSVSQLGTSSVSQLATSSISQLPSSSISQSATTNVSQLRELQYNIMRCLDDDDDKLQKVVRVISEAGSYHTTPKDFVFYLEVLDEKTLRKLKALF